MLHFTFTSNVNVGILLLDYAVHSKSELELFIVTAVVDDVVVVVVVVVVVDAQVGSEFGINGCFSSEVGS